MKAIINAGEEKRIKFLTVINKSIFECILLYLLKEVAELISVIGYLKEKIKSYCGFYFLEKEITYLWQEKCKGSYPSLKLTEPLSKEKRGLFFILMIFRIKKRSKKILNYSYSLLAKKEKNLRSFGGLILNFGNTVKYLFKKLTKPISNLVSRGIFLLDKIFFYSPLFYPIKKEYFLNETRSQMIQVTASFDLEKAERILKETVLWKN